MDAGAQVAILQNAMDKLAGYKNFSYRHTYKQKEAFGDTLTRTDSYVLLKTPEAKDIGYLFKQVSKQTGWQSSVTGVFDGKYLTTLNPADSTFTKTTSVASSPGLVTADLNWFSTFAAKAPAKLAQVKDTTVRSVSCYHLVLNTRDTIINKQHLYTRIHLLIARATGLPVERYIRARTDSFGKEVTDYYTQDTYFNFKTDQPDINRDYFNIPAGYHPPKEAPKAEPALLVKGTIAPDWTLYDSDGKKTTLSLLKGKIVLLDFFFVGCVPCMSTLGPLERLAKRYKDKNFVILSISDRDNKKLVTQFKKAQRITNQMYPDGGNVARLYHVMAAPTFYFIDREGKIAHAVLGYADNFEKEMAAMIDGLVKGE